MNTYDFDRDSMASYRMEDAFVRYLKQHGCKDIKQCQRGVVFHDWDVMADGKTFEVKYDRWFQTTGNVIIETYSNKESGTLGWFMKTKAKWLVVFFNEREFYYLPVSHLRDVWFNNPSAWGMRRIFQKNGYTTICWLSAITSFKDIRYGVLE